MVKGLKPSTSYTLWVAVKNSAGWSGWSDSRVATTAARGRAPWAPNASVLNWVLIDSEDGTHLDGAVLHAQQQQQPAAVEAA